MNATATLQCRECGTEARLEIPTGRITASVLSADADGALLGGLCDGCVERVERADAITEANTATASRRSAARLPRTLRSIDLSRFPDSLAATACEWAEAERPGGLALLGDVGVGKSWLAAAAAWHRATRYPIRFCSAPRIMDELVGENATLARRLLYTSAALILDDLDKARANEYGRQVVFAAIDDRIANDRGLIVTTNLTLTELGERYGEAIASRLAGYCKVVAMSGRDRRVS